MKYAKVLDLAVKFAQQVEKSGQSLVDVLRSVKYKAPQFDCTIWVTVENGILKLIPDSTALRGFQKYNMMDSDEAKELQKAVLAYTNYLKTSVAPEMQRKMVATLKSEGTNPTGFNMGQFELATYSYE